MSDERHTFNMFLAAARAARANDYPINPVAAAAQACHETGFGKHMPPGSNNVLGIKAGKYWKGPTIDAKTHEFYGGRRHDNIMGNWRAYQNIQACFEDYGKIIKGLWWYHDAHKHANGDPFDYLTALKPIYGPDGREVNEPGYFTDPEYVVNVMKLVRQYAPADDGGTPENLLWLRSADGVTQTFEVPKGYDVVQRVDFDTGRHYIHIRKD